MYKPRCHMLRFQDPEIPQQAGEETIEVVGDGDVRWVARPRR